jgi:hypothetical protein
MAVVSSSPLLLRKASISPRLSSTRDTAAS